jgi:hypothetical protein
MAPHSEKINANSVLLFINIWVLFQDTHGENMNITKIALFGIMKL